MTIKSRFILIIFVAFLTACGTTPQSDEMIKVQNTALAMARTGIALTQTALPTATLPPSTFTPTATIVYPTPSPIPTQPPPPIFTPDAIQVERWKEYQLELAKVVIYGYRYGPDIYKNALCEWDILGRSGQEVYIWAYCATIEGDVDVDRIRPAVIYLEANGIIRKVKIAGFKGPDFNLDLFPKDVQEKLDEYYFNVCVNCGRPEELRTHLLYRETHPEVPPLVVLSAKPTVTPAP